MKILVVDDEPTIVKGIKYNLENDGYEVETAGDGLAAVRLAHLTPYDLIILDLMMPKLGGLDACTRIREFSTVPIIILTARSEASDKLMGFESGADDYITKPFDIVEFKARIRALLRRSSMSGSGGSFSTLRFADLIVDPNRRCVVRDGEVIELTSKEYELLELFVRNPGRIYTREQLLEAIWGPDYVGGDGRTVDVHVRKLREKLEADPASPLLILTKWGVGYYIAS